MSPSYSQITTLAGDSSVYLKFFCRYVFGRPTVRDLQHQSLIRRQVGVYCLKASNQRTFCCFVLSEIERNRSFKEESILFSYFLFSDKPEIKKLHDEILYKSNVTYKIQCTVTAYPLPRITWHARNCSNYPNCRNEPFKLLPVSRSRIRFFRTL